MPERPAPADATPSAPEELIERSRRGSREAFGELVRQFEGRLFSYGEGFSIGEAARVMRTNPIRVRVLLHRGRAALARLLEQRATREKTLN